MASGTSAERGARLIPAGACEDFVDVAGGRVRVLRSTAGGAGGVPLLLIHGGGTDNAAISWFELFEAVGSRRAVYAVDLPGFGFTGVEAVGGPEAQADFVAEVAGVLKIGKAVVAGVSMGGDVALNVAVRHAELVAALVLIAPGGLVERFGNRAVHTLVWLMAQLPDRVMDPLARFANRHVGAVLRRTVKDVSTVPEPVFGEFVREARRLGTSMGYRRYNQATIGPTAMRNNLLPVVGTITAPALLFHGEDDRNVDPGGSRAAAERMPAAKLVMVPDCGHWAQLEARDRFLRELDLFLTEQRLA